LAVSQKGCEHSSTIASSGNVGFTERGNLLDEIMVGISLAGVGESGNLYCGRVFGWEFRMGAERGAQQIDV
jgi:hypothetical protein